MPDTRTRRARRSRRAVSVRRDAPVNRPPTLRLFPQILPDHLAQIPHLHRALFRALTLRLAVIGEVGGVGAAVAST